MSSIPRRTFLQSAGTVAAAAALGSRLEAAPQPAESRLRKSVLITMLPKDLSIEDRFKLALDVGFEGIEMQTVADQKEAERIRAAAEQTGLRIHSVMNMDHWRFPLSSSDAAVVDKSVAGMETSLRNAQLWGAEVVLLVPAVVDAQTPYRDAWIRSQRVIRRRILPLAEKLEVIVGIEEVWNKFLLSPLEFAQYHDEFTSPWLRAYFDVGNVVFYGYPQDWIRTLGKRTVRLHVKDFQLERGKGQFFWRNLGEGDIDWPEVRAALQDVGYSGWVTTEIPGGDEPYLRDVVARLDRIFEGRRPVES
jgi:L-ribulose-5-phosphate 3-epimerase